MKRKPRHGNVRVVRAIENNIRSISESQAGTVFYTESYEERKLSYWLQRAPNVRDFRSQPEEFWYINSVGERKRYVPDLMVYFKDSTIAIIEITLAERREAKGIVPEREIAALLICQERAWKYWVFTKKVLPNDTELANLEAMYMFRATAFCDDRIRQCIFDYMPPDESRKLGQILNHVATELQLEDYKITPTINHLISTCVLGMDMQLLFFRDAEPIRQMPIWIAKEGEYDFKI